MITAVACGGSKAPDPVEPTEPVAETPAEPVTETPAEPVAEKPVEPPAPPAPPPPPAPVLTVKDAGLITPESVLFDEANDVYLVSNVNGDPATADGNGFISAISPEGQVVALKWVDGSKKATKLNAPKGMALVDGLLYVADINTVRIFDRKTGKAKGEVKIPKATFLNDIAVGPDGKIYVTDSGIKLTEKGPEPTKTDGVWVIEKKKAKQIAKGDELGGPNGILVTDAGIWVNTFVSGEIYMVDAAGARTSIQKLPKGGLDGLAVAGDSVLVSSWEGQGVFKGTPGGEFTLAFPNISSPADIAVDTKRSRLLVPVMGENTVLIYELE